VRSVRVVGFRTFAPMILKYQFIKIRSRHLNSRSRKRNLRSYSHFDASSRQLVGFLYSLSQMFSSNFHHHSISIHPSFHPPSTYIHSFIIIISHMISVNSLTFLIKPRHFVILFVVITFPRLSFFREKKRQNYECVGHLSICLCFFYEC